MARGPQGQYRPNDAVSAAAAILRIATGESDEEREAARPAANRKRTSSSATAKPLVTKTKSTDG